MKTKILNIIDETYNTKTFLLTKPNGFKFNPGQHISIKIPNTDSIKPFTLTSIPDDENISLTIKKVGKGTSMIFSLNIGDFLEIKGPYESKLSYVQTDKDLLYIAGGSGITPFISHLRYLKKEKIKKKIILIYANKTKQDIIFFNELKTYPNLKLINVLSEEDSGDEQGHVNKEIINKYAPNLKNYKIFICGPPKFEEAMNNIVFS